MDDEDGRWLSPRAREFLKFVAVVVLLLIISEAMLWLLLWTMSNAG